MATPYREESTEQQLGRIQDEALMRLSKDELRVLMALNPEHYHTINVTGMSRFGMRRWFDPRS